jgi:hypothetical protein
MGDTSVSQRIDLKEHRSGLPSETSISQSASGGEEKRTVQ